MKYCEIAQRIVERQGEAVVVVATDEIGNYCRPTDLYYHIASCDACNVDVCNVEPPNVGRSPKGG